jgi:hypothetical protein
MKTIPFLPLAFCAAFLFVVPAAVCAETSVAESNLTTVDTRGAGTPTATSVGVFGRVLSQKTQTPLAGVTLTLAGSSTISDSAGVFSLANAELSSGTTLNATLSGYLTKSQTVTAGTGGKSLVVPDVMLTAVADAASRPVVQSVVMTPLGVLVKGFNTKATALANVNWNGNTPGGVAFYANNVLVSTETGAGPGYSCLVNIDDRFSPSNVPMEMKVVATASGNSAVSDPMSTQVRVIASPTFLSGMLDKVVTGDGNFRIDFNLAGAELKYDLPVIGRFGWKFTIGASFDYTITDGSWEIGLGVNDTGTRERTARPIPPGAPVKETPVLYLGSKEIKVSIYGCVAGTANLTDGIKVATVSLNAGIEAKLELNRFGIPDLAGPGLTTALSKVVPGNALNFVSIIVYATPSISGKITFVATTTYDFQEALLAGGIGLEAAYEPAFNDDVKFRIYVGGKITVEFGYPSPIFRKVNFKAYTGVEAALWVVNVKREYVFVDWSYPAAGRRLPATGFTGTGGGYMIEAAGNANTTWQPIDRPWLAAGPEQFLADASRAAARRLPTDSTALDLFNRMGQAPSPGAAFVPGSGPSRRIASDSTLPAQEELPLISNLFSQSSPSLAAPASGSSLMLAYVSDTGVANPIQFTNVAYTFYNGTAWSTPAAIAAAANAQFAPKVAFDGAGNAIAVWEQIKDPAFAGTEIEAIGAQLEIMWSRWTSATQTWSPAVALTDNSFLDRAPQLAGPMANGDLILTWIQNEANLLTGSATGNSRVMTARWNKTAGNWGTPSVLVDNLVGDLSHALAASGNKAVYLWSKDVDGNLDDSTDSDLFYRIWDEGTGAWGTETRYTNDAIADKFVKVKLDSSGNIYPVWQKGTALVLDKNFAGVPVSVRPDSTSAGFADVALSVGPGGNVVVIWQEMSEFGPCAHYRVFDPASNTWGLDTLLSNDSDLERSFAPVWDSVGNLVFAYNNVAITETTKTVAIEGGGSITVDGVPTPGQVDLLVARRSLVKDLSLAADSLTATGTTFQAGDAITLTANVTNSGNLAVQNVQVGFYDGDPQNGGTLIQTATLPGWLKAADTQVATVNWTIPSPVAAHTVYAVVDPGAQVTESVETNNTQSLGLNGVDLELTYLSGSVARDGSVHVIVQVKNIGAPASPVTTLKLWPQDNPGATPLATKDVSLLNPGESVQVAVDLPAGSQPEGDASYLLTLDEDMLSGDVSTFNNQTRFSLHLFISTANDGIPDSWKRLYGFSVSDPTVAGADSDGDGFTNYQEFLCGTNPKDSSSKLKIGDLNVLMQADGKSAQFTVSWVPAANRYYTVERSFDLKTWAAIATQIQAVTPLNTYTDNVTFPTGGKKCFYRVHLE